MEQNYVTVTLCIIDYSISRLWLINRLINTCSQLPSVLWRCWLGGRKGIRPVKNWVVRCWRGYLSGARCRLPYGHCHSLFLASVKSRLVVPEKGPLNGCVCVCVCVCVIVAAIMPIRGLIRAYLSRRYTIRRLSACRCLVVWKSVRRLRRSRWASCCRASSTSWRRLDASTTRSRPGRARWSCAGTEADRRWPRASTSAWRSSTATTTRRASSSPDTSCTSPRTSRPTSSSNRCSTITTAIP